MAVENKGFGALFAEKKNSLDHLQKGMASILPSFPGMPAAKYFDLCIGIDFHDTVFPPAPLLPVPHIGMVFDIISAIFAAIASVVPPPPPPPPEEEGKEPAPQPFSLAATAQMLVHAMSPSVKVHQQWIANAGTPILHLPAIIAHLPFPIVKPKAASEMWMGSSTVLADGGPFSTQFHPALSCNLVGLPSPPRLNKKSSALALMAPTSMLLIITSGGKPVLVGGPPTIDLFQLMFKLGLKGVSKAAGAAFQKTINRVKSKYPRLGAMLQKAKCKTFGEPVDAVTGRVIAANVDFSLPGPIPLLWERHYYSDADVPGPLGYNWHHAYNLHLHTLEDGTISVRLPDGRETVMPALLAGDSYYSRNEQLWWRRENGGYILEDNKRLQYHFLSQPTPDGRYPLSTIRNQAGFTITFRYNSNGYLERITDSSHRTLQIDTDPQGRITCVHTRNNGQIIRLVSYSYDDHGNLATTSNALQATKYFFYRHHQLIKLTNQSGLSFYWEYDKPGENGRCIHTWGDGGILAYHAVYERGKTTVTNSLGHATTYHYDDRHLIHKITGHNGGHTVQAYNLYGELEVVTDPEGNSIKNEYDDHGFLLKSINANGEATSYSYDEQHYLVKVKSPGGIQCSWEFNEDGQITRKKMPGGQTQRYYYEEKLLKAIHHSNGRSFRFGYDQQYNLTTFITPEATRLHWQYDELGHLGKESMDNGYWHEYTYDAAGHMTQWREADQSVHHFHYDDAGNLLQAGDGQRAVNFTYGPLGILTSRSQQQVHQQLNYDKELQLTSVANAAGALYRLERDAQGNIAREWNFDGQLREYQRDKAGRVQKILRPGQRWTTYEYDSAGRIVLEKQYDGSTTAYAYNKDGQLSAAFNENGEITLQRDTAGRIILEKQGAYQVTRLYNEHGYPTAIHSNLGAAITLQHSDAGLLESITAANGTQAPWEARWERNHYGQEQQRTIPGAITIDTQRDKQGRIQRQSINGEHTGTLCTRYEWGKAGKLQRLIHEATSQQVRFDYDEFDRLLSAGYTTSPGSVAEYIYRLPDKAGNLFQTTGKKDRNYTKGGQLQECPDYYYHYDPEGQLVFREFKHNSNSAAINKQAYARQHHIPLKGSRTGWAYEWNANGLLQQVITPSGAHIVYRYDPLGRRICKENKRTQTVTRWVWNGNVPLHEWKYTGSYDQQLQIIANGDINPTPEPVEHLSTWIFEEGTFIPCAKLEDQQQYSLVPDHLGTPQYAYNSDGKQVWHRETDCYGKTRHLTGDSNFCNYLYQGQYDDTETGLCYNRFRYYDKENGNYISPDPLSIAGGLNTYAYVQDPNRWVDIFGLNPILESIQQQVNTILSDHLPAIREIDPNAGIGYRGSVASGISKVHDPALARPFNPESFDVDGFIKSDYLAYNPVFTNRRREASNIPGMEDIEQSIDRRLREAFPGLREEAFSFRIFKSHELAEMARAGDVQVHVDHH